MSGHKTLVTNDEYFVMTKGQRYDRRTVLRGTAALGAGSLAGCSMFSEETQPAQSAEPLRDAPRWVGPQEARPESGEQAGHEYLVDRGPQQGTLYIWREDKWHRIDEHAESRDRFAAQSATGGSGTPDDPWTLEADVVPDGGTVYFQPGNYAASALATPPAADYEQTAMYLRGAGVRTTTLTDDATDGSLITFQSDSSGNFGGVSDMSVLGQFPDKDKRSKGHLIHGTGKIIDTLYENLIVRYSWGDGLRLEASTSGTRLRNSWIENNFGWNVYLGGGTRLKLSNLHIVTGKSGGIYLRPSYSQVSGVSIVNCSPGLELAGANNTVTNVYVTDAEEGPAIREGDVTGNVVSNTTIKASAVGIATDGTRSQYTNVGVFNAKREAVRLNGTGVSVTGLTVSGFASASNVPAIDCSGSNCRLTGVSLAQPSRDGTTVAARISGSHTTLSNIVCQGTKPWQLIVDNAVETVLDSVRGVTFGTLKDKGTRTLLNRQGTNAGDPRSTGEWNGHGGYASAMGATVWNTNTTPWTAFRADGAGNWVQTV
ncbi:right-handed parallel beta-helix repeat-containing protein [Halocatena pleomorpha]|uniref:Right-handed parallel beta-helix repeat-containing protein n=2 Tax=Halocatena pleomorpha TaxID=1785090 RepID=A0A3P3R4D5_9EURY|nr:right-handed parallel beta-helix repeat-containing protein [Halocatena pleomorpha]